MQKISANFDIILVTPLDHTGIQQYFHIGLLQLATYLQNLGWKVCFFDRNAKVYGEKKSIHEVDLELEQTVKTAGTTLIGFTCYTSHFNDLAHCVHFLKKSSPQLLCFAGGAHPTFQPTRTLQQIPELDLVIKGAGEIPCQQLLHNSHIPSIPGVAYRTGSKIIETKQLTPSLTQGQPFPNYELIDSNFYWHSNHHMYNGLKLHSMATLVTSTPCPGKCTFCIGNKAKTGHFSQQPEQILAEMEILHNKYGVKGFWLADRDFVLNKKRALSFCEQKRNSKLHNIPWATTSRVNQLDDQLAKALFEATCIAMCLGLESGSQKILDYFQKDTTVSQNISAMQLLDKHKILGMGSFILGVPSQTEDDILANYSLLDQIRLHDGGVLMLMPVVGTKIFDTLTKNGKINPDDPATWEETSSFNGHLVPTRNYSSIPHSKFIKLFDKLADTVFKTCSKNRKTLINEYGHAHHFADF